MGPRTGLPHSEGEKSDGGQGVSPGGGAGGRAPRDDFFLGKWLAVGAPEHIFNCLSHFGNKIGRFVGQAIKNRTISEKSEQVAALLGLHLLFTEWCSPSRQVLVPVRVLITMMPFTRE